MTSTYPRSRRSRPRLLRLLAAPLAAVLAAAALTLGALPVAAASATTGATTTGWIRAAHLSPGTPKADVRLTPFSGGSPRTLDSVSFGEFSPYTRVPTGLYTVSLVKAGSPMSAAPMISQNVRVNPGQASTVIATGKAGQVRASVLSDDLTPPGAGQARVRLVSASTNPPSIDAAVVGGAALANDVMTGSSTGYAEVPAQTWSVRVASSNGQDPTVDRVPVQAGGIYTLVALDSPTGGLSLRAVRDSAGSTSAAGMMPTGGVDTGGGGLAHRDTGAPLSTTLPAALLVVLLGLYAVQLGRRHRTAR